MWRHPITSFRIIGIAEALSFLVLLGIAMPLKYLWGMPLAVRIVGSIHGGLFILYLLAAVRAARFAGWPFKRLLEAFFAALLPFGPFYFDRKLQNEAALLEPE